MSIRLNLGTYYCPTWTVDNAIREVVQNTIDGAVEWATSSLNKGKEDLVPASRWSIKSIKPPKKHADAGFGHARLCELVLTVDKDSYTRPNKFKDWHRNPNSLAYIKMVLVGKEEMNLTPDNVGEQPEGTVLVEFEAVNRIGADFRMWHIQRLGQTGKLDKQNQTGQFGEGFKVGALVAVRNGYKVLVEAYGKRRQFVIKNRQLCVSKQDSRLSNEAKDNENLIYVRFKLGKPAHDNNHRFNTRFFRLLSPGASFNKTGQILLDDASKGEIYCMGIFVEKRDQSLLGYDISDKNVISGRDRLQANNSLLRRHIRELFEQALEEGNDGLMGNLFENLRAITDESSLHSLDEVAALFQSDRLARKLVEIFAQTEGENAFPCRKSEKEEVERNLRKRKPVVLASTLVDLLRKPEKDGYRDLNAELDFLFSEENKIEISDDGEKLIEYAVTRLNTVREDITFSRDHFVPIDGLFLRESEDLYCRYRDEKYFINDRLLRANDGKSPHEASHHLGFVVARKTNGISNFLYNYCARNGRATQPVYQIRIQPHPSGRLLLLLSEELLARSPKIGIMKVDIIESQEASNVENGQRIPIGNTIIPRAHHWFNWLRLRGGQLAEEGEERTGEEECEEGHGEQVYVLSATKMIEETAVLDPDTKYLIQAFDPETSLPVRDPITGAKCFATATTPSKDDGHGHVNVISQPSQAVTSASAWNHILDAGSDGDYIEDVSSSSVCEEIYDVASNHDEPSDQPDEASNHDEPSNQPDEASSHHQPSRGDAQDYLQSSSSVCEEIYEVASKHDEPSDQPDEPPKHDEPSNQPDKASSHDEPSRGDAQDYLQSSLTKEHLASIFSRTQVDDLPDYDSDTFSDEGEGRKSKRQRMTRPRDLKQAQFGQRILRIGGAYRDERDGSYVKVIRFVGKMLPPEGAICKTIRPLISTLNSFGGAPLDVSEEDELSNEWVAEETAKDAKSLSFLSREVSNRLPEKNIVLELNRVNPAETNCFCYAEYRRFEASPVSTDPDQLPSKPRELVLNAGIGSSAIGDIRAGFHVGWLVEKDHLSAASLGKTNPNALIFDEDVALFLDKCERGETGYPRKGENLVGTKYAREGDVDHIYASCANHNDCNDAIRAVEMFRPTTGTIVSAPGLLREENMDQMKKMMLALIQSGHQFRLAVHDAKNYGDPQRRQRVVLTFARRGIRLPMTPMPTHGVAGNPETNVLNAFFGLPLETKTGCGILEVWPGSETVTYNHVEGATIDTKEEQRRLEPYAPAPTIMANSRVVHYAHERPVTLRELARLFSLPDDLQLFGTPSQIRRQIETAFPVELAQAIAQSIMCVYRGTTEMQDSNCPSTPQRRPLADDCIAL